MPTNDERREVAAKLRELVQESARYGDDGVGERACRVLLGPRVDLLDVVDAHFPLARLADLIEPEDRTCRNMYEGAVKGPFTCSACGEYSKTWYHMGFGDMYADVPNFCPNCGAKVVRQ